MQEAENTNGLERPSVLIVWDIDPARPDKAQPDPAL